MSRKISWTNNSIGHSGTYVYRAPTLDPQALPAPVATVDPVAQGALAEWIDNEDLAAGDYDYAVQDFDGQGVGALSTAVTHNVPADLSTAAIGDAIGGGVYGGTHGNGTGTWHLIFAKQSAETNGMEWGNYNTTTGANDPDDGRANQELVLTSFDNGESDAFYYCRDYVDAEGNSDYYLPARNELAKADALVNASHPEFSTSLDRERWSSTENTGIRVWGRNFSTRSEIEILKYKTTFAYTRPVRRVPV